MKSAIYPFSYWRCFVHIFYPVAPELWPTTPIRRGKNVKTGLIEGDDSGYRKVRTLPQNSAPLVQPAILCRPSYDGVREDGKIEASLSLPGGLCDGVLVVRETFARDLQDADQLLLKVFGGEYRLCALDGFRSGKRQAAGFTRMLNTHMGRLGITPETVDGNIEKFVTAGYSADGTFSWVNADVKSPQFAAVAAELRGNARIFDQLRAYAATLTSDGSVTLEALEEAIYNYITVSANSGIGRAAGHNVPLIFENNAHAGGGACDVFLVNAAGQPLNHVPFDYPGPEAGMDYLEKDENFDAYRTKAATDAAIRSHLLTVGLAPETFNRKDWERFRGAIRVVYHLVRAKGWTFYSSEQGGENWHLEGNNKCYCVGSGVPFNSELHTVAAYPDSGNPGHALQLHGPEAVAVWGGAQDILPLENSALRSDCQRKSSIAVTVFYTVTAFRSEQYLKAHIIHQHSTCVTPIAAKAFLTS